MKLFRNNIIISRLFCILMAFHIFNVSVDMPDTQPDYIAEDLSVNDMESVIEIVLEKGLDIENAIAEHDEHDENDAQNFELSKDFKFCSNKVHTHLFNNLGVIISHRVINYNESFYDSYIYDILSPPPQA